MPPARSEPHAAYRQSMSALVSREYAGLLVSLPQSRAPSAKASEARVAHRPACRRVGSTFRLSSTSACLVGGRSRSVTDTPCRDGRDLVPLSRDLDPGSRNPPGELPEGEDCVFRRPPVVIMNNVQHRLKLHATHTSALSTNHTLIVAQHETRFNGIGQQVHLIWTIHQLEQREHALSTRRIRRN